MEKTNKIWNRRFILLSAMSKAGVKKMPVVIDGKIVGIASRSAITRYLISRYLEQTEQSVLQVGNQPAPASQKA